MTSEITSRESFTACRLAIKSLEFQTGMQFGAWPSKQPPLLLSVRSSHLIPKYIPPDHPFTHTLISSEIETVNIGMNSVNVKYFTNVTGDERYGLVLQMSFLEAFGTIVLKTKQGDLETISRRVRIEESVDSNCQLSIMGLKRVIIDLLEIIPVPENPYDQLSAVIDSMLLKYSLLRFHQFRPILSCHVHGTDQKKNLLVTYSNPVHQLLSFRYS